MFYTSFDIQLQNSPILTKQQISFPNPLSTEKKTTIHHNNRVVVPLFRGFIPLDATSRHLRALRRAIPRVVSSAWLPSSIYARRMAKVCTLKCINFWWEQSLCRRKFPTPVCSAQLLVVVVIHFYRYGFYLQSLAGKSFSPALYFDFLCAAFVRPKEAAKGSLRFLKPFCVAVKKKKECKLNCHDVRSVVILRLWLLLRANPAKMIYLVAWPLRRKELACAMLGCRKWWW